MVFAQDSLRLRGHGPISGHAPDTAQASADWHIELFDTLQPVKADWFALEAETTLPFATFAWAEAWFESVALERRHKTVILVGRDAAGRTAFILPFVQEQRGPFAVLLWPGGTHCAYQSGLFSSACRVRIAEIGADAFWANIFSTVSGVDAIAAYGLPEMDSENNNPLHALPSIQSGCSSYRFALAADWTSVYESKCTARLRSDNRRCERRMGELGDVCFHVAETAEEREQLIETMLDQKSVQLQDAGAPDFTAGAGIRGFYRRLASSPHWTGDTRVFVAALELDGVPAAVNFGLIKGGTFHGLILSMGDGEAAKFAPGRLLLKRSVELFCGEGLEAFDLGAGEESNKLKWADGPVGRREVLVPLSVKGRIFLAGLRMFLAAKCQIKRSPRLWRFFSQYRKHFGC